MVDIRDRGRNRARGPKGGWLGRDWRGDADASRFQPPTHPTSQPDCTYIGNTSGRQVSAPCRRVSVTYRRKRWWWR